MAPRKDKQKSPDANPRVNFQKKVRGLKKSVLQLSLPTHEAREKKRGQVPIIRSPPPPFLTALSGLPFSSLGRKGGKRQQQPSFLPGEQERRSNFTYYTLFPLSTKKRGRSRKSFHALLKTVTRSTFSCSGRQFRFVEFPSPYSCSGYWKKGGKEHSNT